jgi:hypothetical protein
MKKYVKGFEQKIKPKVDAVTGQTIVEPFRDAQQALVRAQFTSRERETFFDDAFQDIMVQIFEKWVLSEPHAVKEREYLYHVCMGLGSVKEMLARYEMFGKNAERHLAQQKKEQEGSDEEEGTP